MEALQQQLEASRLEAERAKATAARGEVRRNGALLA
jgi:hypothetical protein